MLQRQEEDTTSSARFAHQMNHAHLQSANEVIKVVHLALNIEIVVVGGIGGHAGAQSIRREDVKLLGKQRNIFRPYVGAGMAGEIAAVNQHHGLARARFVIACADAVYVHELGVEPGNLAIGGKFRACSRSAEEPEKEDEQSQREAATQAASAYARIPSLWALSLCALRLVNFAARSHG